jgi:hypothetical protein
VKPSSKRPMRPAQSSESIPFSHEPCYFRRCHGCDVVFDYDSENANCQGCGKFSAPFFYFDDQKLKFTDTEMRPYYLIPQGAYGPLIGLSAHWRPDE